MLNVTNHQENANQNYNEILPHICQMGITNKNVFCEDVKKFGTLAHLLGTQKGTAVMENSMEFPQKFKNRTTM